jgi:outer membrane protein assembly factor BamE (lipoprotein component of BamABCDE complex)
MRSHLAVLFSLTISLSGCANLQVSRAKAELEAALNPLLGQTKDDVLMAIGAPNGTRSIGGFEVWDYYKSYGMRARQSAVVNTYGTANTNAYNYPGGYNATTNYQGNAVGLGGSQSWEAYDRFTLYFDGSGRMAKWDGYVQR